MQIYAEELYEALKTICLECWSNLTAVHFGLPRIEITRYPHVVIRVDSIPIEGIYNAQEQVYSFDIIYRGAWSTAPTFNIELQKTARVNEFLAEFTSSTTIGDIGVMPTVNDITFVESDDPNEPFYDVVINVGCTVHDTWNS